MRLPIFQVDAFASDVFTGNPAAVVPLDRWSLADTTMQAIARENNLSETAFFVPSWEHVPDLPHYRLRWFKPAVEVDLCGHATLATAWVVFEKLCPGATRVRFDTRSGPLVVERDARSGDRLVMDFPAQALVPKPEPADLAAALGCPVLDTLGHTDLVVIVPDEETVAALRPDLSALGRYEVRGVAVTAPGSTDGVDFVSRFFAPQSGVPEDPVTGSLHCELVPYWAERLGKTSLHARQLSARGGDVWCELRGDRVTLAGTAVPYLEGTITVPDGR